MSRLEELIAQLCPDGVEYKSLKNIAEIGTGSSNRIEADEEGVYPFYVRSKNIQKSNKYIFNEEAIIIPGEGGVGDVFHYINGKYNLHQRAYRIHFFSDIINTKFAYYYLIANFKKFILIKAVNATVLSIRKPMIEKFPIPLPPLPVQQEIVRILDNFTELTAELTAELTGRKKQYEYYRDRLLAFQDSDNSSLRTCAKYESLSQVLKIKNGRDYKKYKQGEVPVYGTGGVITCINTPIYDKPSVLIPRKGSINKLYYVDIPFWTVDTIFYTEIYTHIMIPKFVYYYLQTLHLENLNTAGGVPSLTQAVLNKILIPIPSLEEQARIVRILDHFDRLVNDITSGLPAEIEARRKQYEYYRDQLLTFKEAARESV